MLIPPLSAGAEGKRLTRFFESCRLHSYPDTNGVWTVGYGTTGPDIVQGLTITQAQADAWLDVRMSTVAGFLNRNLPAGVNQGQFDALLDFGYNQGATALFRSQLWGRVKVGDHAGVVTALESWIYIHTKAGKIRSEWQVKRRAAEIELYSTGAWTTPAA